MARSRTKRKVQAPVAVLDDVEVVVAHLRNDGGVDDGTGIARDSPR